MGYNTYHSLEVVEPRDEAKSKEIIADLRQSSEVAFHSLDEKGNYTNPANWEGLLDDLVALSERHPGCLLMIEAEGDDTDDQWRAWFRDGSHYREDYLFMEAPEFREECLEAEEALERWTVVLLYPSHATADYGGELYVDFASCDDAEEAAAIVQGKAAEANDGNVEAHEFRPILVLPGHVDVELEAADFDHPQAR